MENLSKGQMDKMTKNELVGYIEAVQKTFLAVENSDDASLEQKAEADNKFGLLQRAKNAIKSGAAFLWNGTKKVYISTKTFVTRLFHRVKAFLSTCWEWLRGLAAIVIDTCMSALRALGAFLGRLIGRCVKGVKSAFDKGVRIIIPAEEDDVDAMQREGLAETKRLDRPDLEERCERATESLEASAAAAEAAA